MPVTLLSTFLGLEFLPTGSGWCCWRPRPQDEETETRRVDEMCVRSESGAAVELRLQTSISMSIFTAKVLRASLHWGKKSSGIGPFLRFGGC